MGNKARQATRQSGVVGRKDPIMSTIEALTVFVLALAILAVALHA